MTTLTRPDEATHRRINGLLAEIERLNEKLAAAGNGSAIDLLARATAAEAECVELRDEAILAAAANDALRSALAAVTAQAKRAETETREWQETLRITREAVSKGATEARRRHAAQLAEVRAELEQVRASLSARSSDQGDAGGTQPSRGCRAGDVLAVTLSTFVIVGGAVVEAARNWPW